MVRYGEIVKAKITDENEVAYIVQIDGKAFALDKAQVEDVLKREDEIEGIAYEDKLHKARFQCELPLIRPGFYGWGEVVQVRKDLGVFVDVGLFDKEVVVSLDDLPEDLQLWPKKSDKLFLTYEVDQKNRFWGKLADEAVFQKRFIKADLAIKNQNLTFTVYKVKLAGALCITTERYAAFLHKSEYLDQVRIGQVINGRCIGVRPDGGINVSAKPRVHEALAEDAQMIATILSKQPDGYLPYHDKSDPEAIQSYFGLSKAQFKRAVGQLIKQGLIVQDKGKGIQLVQKD